MKNEEIMKVIEEADAVWTDRYLDAAINRKRELSPDWEIMYLALERQAGEEKWKQIQKILKA